MPLKAKLRNLRIDKLSLVDAGAQEPARIELSKRRTPAEQQSTPAAVMKRGRLTSDADGHCHLYDDESLSGSTSYDYSSSGHSHPYVIEDGIVTIGMAQGHSHDARTASATTTDKAAPRGAAPQETAMAMTAEETAQFATFKALSEMPTAQRAHYDALDEVGKAAFVAKGAPERAEVIRKAAEADPVVYTAPDGTTVRKSQDPTGLVVKALKRADEAEATASVEKAARERTELRKRAEEVLKHMPGTIDERADALDAVEKIADPAKREAAMRVLKAGDAAMAGAFVLRGFDAAEPDANSAQARLDAKVEKHATTHKISKGKALLEITKANGEHTDEEARDLYAEAKAERAAAPSN